MAFSFSIQQKIPGALGRAGVIETSHGLIQTPAFVAVGTKATVKAVTPEMLRDIGVQVVLGNTYHLYLEPGPDIVRDAGGIGRFMHWPGPTVTDSGGFQVFSLGEAYGRNITKIAKGEVEPAADTREVTMRMADIEEDGVWFSSIIDGSRHFFTPEKSIGVQHDLGADIIFAFDECTSPQAPYEYQEEAMRRTHEWAIRSLYFHQKEGKVNAQALFGIVQGGRFADLRQESARFLAKLDFPGFGIGGSFVKEDIDLSVGFVNKILPEEKPRHLLGIGEPADLLNGIEQGVDLFDCVQPTRIARNGGVYTRHGKVNLLNAKFVRDFLPIDEGCSCYTCRNYTAAYLAHLFRAKEMLAATLASVHNLHFIVLLVRGARQAILEGRFTSYQERFFETYHS
jgi:queuine tRNA-ribosyltransferase